MASTEGSAIKLTVGDQALLIYPSEDDVAAGLAEYTAKLSEKYAKERGAFTVVLSGGYLIDCLRLFYFIVFASLLDLYKFLNFTKKLE